MAFKVKREMPGTGLEAAFYAAPVAWGYNRRAEEGWVEWGYYAGPEAADEGKTPLFQETVTYRADAVRFPGGSVEVTRANSADATLGKPAAALGRIYKASKGLPSFADAEDA